MSTPADELKAAATALRTARFAGAMTATPAVAALIRARLPLADWLEYHAAMSDRLHSLVDGVPDGSEHPALAVARQINGGTTP